MQSIQKYGVLICTMVSLILLLTATTYYPGGSIHDKNAVGFDWAKNFFSNLFQSAAINGMSNPSRIWAMVAMAFHSLAFGLFFIHMSQKIIDKHPSLVLKSVGLVNIVFSFLIATPLHDLMIVLSSSLFLLALFYITVFIFKTRHAWLKFACVFCLIVFYFTLFLYGYGNWGWLAIMQKVSFALSMLLVLSLEHFTKKEDFTPTSN